MKFLVDAQLPPTLAEWLKTKGFDAIHPIEVEGGLSMTDTQLWKIELSEQRIIISKDRDFRERALLKSPPKVVHIMVGNCSNADLFLRLEKVWTNVIEVLKGEVKVAVITQNELVIY